MGCDLRPRAEHITKLNLTIMGVPGTHGSRGWQKDATGSAAGVRYWRKAINSMVHLENLSIIDEQGYDNEYHFADRSMSNQEECILDWFLPGLKPPRFRTLFLNRFRYNHATLAESLRQIWPYLDSLTFANAELFQWRQDSIRISDDKLEAVYTAEQSQFLHGLGWLELCQHLRAASPEGRILLSCVGAGIGYETPCGINAKYGEMLRESGVTFIKGYNRRRW